jgi:hypothetical protein
MKKHLYICLIISFLNNLQAQDEQSKTPILIEHSVGVNTASIFRKILKVPSDSATNNSQYLFMYKIRIGKNGFRVSGLANFSSETEQVPGFLDSKTVKTKNYAARLGYERQSVVSKKFTASFGADVVWEYQENSSLSDSGFDQVLIKRSQYGVGAGPFLGITWHLSKRLSLYSEVATYYSVGRKSKIVDFVKNPEFNDVDNRTTFAKTNYVVPTGLFLQYHF